jgi:ketosteroid isomerase-like protein
VTELSERQRRNVELAQAAFAAYNTGDIDSLLAGFDPELELHAAPGLVNAGTYRGRRGFVDWVTQWNEAWEEFRVEPLRVEPIGERHVLVDLRQTGHGAGSGVVVEMDVFWAFETNDDVTTRAHLYPRREEAVAAIESWRAEAG